MMRHWTTFTFKCESCGDTVYVSQEAIDEAKANDLPPDQALTADKDYAEGLSYCLRCADVDEELEPGSVAGERDGLLHHPVSGQSLPEVAGLFLQAARTAKRALAERFQGDTIMGMAREMAEQDARHASTADLREFYAAVAIWLAEV